MTEIQLRQNLVSTAKGYIGATKGSAQHKKIVDIYNGIKPLPVGYKLKTSDAWCAGFGSAMAAECDLTDIIPPECSCPRQITAWQKLDRWVENDAYVPSPGDYIYYDWDDSGSGDNKGSADHVGIVCEVSGGVITVIEGNKGSPSAVGYRKIAVNSRYIRGFGAPNFASKATKAASVTPDAKPVTVSASASKASKAVIATSAMPTLQSGSIGANVKALQYMLIGLGYSCGKCGADGDFGAATKSAVIKFQDGHNLITDGVVGAVTWNALKSALPSVSKGSKNKIVSAVQTLLVFKGYPCGNNSYNDVDGNFGSKTHSALVKYQKVNGLQGDGVCGPLTWGKLIGG